MTSKQGLIQRQRADLYNSFIALAIACVMLACGVVLSNKIAEGRDWLMGAAAFGGGLFFLFMWGYLLGFSLYCKGVLRYMPEHGEIPLHLLPHGVTSLLAWKRKTRH